MDEIEVNIKLASNNKTYNIPIRKSDTILKLKEYCKIISNIPQDQQNLLYKGKMLLDEKLIKYYNIENNQNIILVKKKIQKSGSLNQNSKINFFNIINLNESDNKEINLNEVFNICNIFPDIASLYNNLDLNRFDDFYQLLGVGNFKDIIGIEPQKMKEILKDPSTKEMMNDMLKDPSIIEMLFNNPMFRTRIQNNRFLKFVFQNLNFFANKIANNSNYLQIGLNTFKENKRDELNSGTGISIPPDPFENANNNQIMNSSSQISDINSFNNIIIENKDNFKNSRINIDLKEKYKDQLSQLKSMGFSNEEINIQTLNKTNGNIENAIDKILEQNN